MALDLDSRSYHFHLHGNLGNCHITPAEADIKMSVGIATGGMAILNSGARPTQFAMRMIANNLGFKRYTNQ